MKKIFLAFLIFYSLFAFSQKSITGTVNDSLKNEVIPFSSIALLSLPDSVIVKGTITDDKGNFRLNELKNGTYALKISAVGYLNKTIGNIPIDSGGTKEINLQIKLAVSSYTFNEVSVTAIKRTVEFKNNNIIVNVEDSPLAKGNSVFDLLFKIPGISVENDEIKMQGKSGVVVMIDDRPQSLSPQQLANMLRGMPADIVKKIEVLKNPPVKYDASGTTGIINVITKKTTVMGFTGTVFSSHAQGFYSTTMLGMTLNYKSKKITFYSNVSGMDNRSRQAETFEKRFEENGSFTYLSGQSILKPHGEDINGKVGLDYNISSTSVIGVKITSNPGIYTFNSSGKNYLSGDPLAKYNYLGANNYMYDDWVQTDASLDFNHKLDTLGSNFSIITDYTIVPEYVLNKTYNGYYDTFGNELVSPDIYQNIDRSSSNLFSVRGNLSKIIDTTSSFETGFKFSHIKTWNDYLFERDFFNNGIYMKDEDLSNKFDYRELTYAGYFNYNKTIRKLSMQLGVRIENTYLKGSSDKQFELSKKYFQVFPNISFDYKKNENNSFQLTLTRRINRPGFFILNPIRQYRDIYYYQEGNPGLVPEFANKAELSYSYKSMFSTAVAYVYVEQPMLGFTSQIDTAKLTIERVKNMNYNSTIEWSVFYQKTVLKKWDVSISGSVQYLKFVGDIDGVIFKTKGLGSNANLTNTILLGKYTKLELGGMFYGPQVYSIIHRKINWGAQVAVKFSLLKEKLDLTLGVDDVFRSQKWMTSARFETQHWDYSRRSDTWRARIALNYKFGKIKIEERKVASDEDKERLGH